MLVRGSKKGLSPVITTILLVLLAVILAGIIFLWAKGFVKEGLVKFGEPIERACEKIKFEAAISGEDILLTNRGDVPIYKLRVVSSSAGSSSGVESSQAINPGESKTITEVSAVSGSKVVPIILGTSKDNAVQEYECPKKYWFTLD
jgi:flagellin-like protein